MDGCPHRSCGIRLKRFRCGESFDVLCVMRIEIAGLISDESDDHDVHSSLAEFPQQPVAQTSGVRCGRLSTEDMGKRFMGHDRRGSCFSGVLNQFTPGLEVLLKDCFEKCFAFLGDVQISITLEQPSVGFQAFLNRC